MPVIHIIYHTEAGPWIHLFAVRSWVKLNEKEYQKWIESINYAEGFKSGKRAVSPEELAAYGITLEGATA